MEGNETCCFESALDFVKLSSVCVMFNYWHPNVVIDHIVLLVTDQVAGSWGGMCVTRPSITVV